MAKISTGTKTVTTAGTRVALAGSGQAKALAVTAKQTNAGSIYVGDATVSSSVTPPLNPGDTITMSADDPFNLADVYLDSQINGEAADYVAVL